MDDRKWVLLAVLSFVALVALVAVAFLLVGWRTQAPPGQKGLKGTGMERSPVLFSLQMGLPVLLAACVAAAVGLLKS